MKQERLASGKYIKTEDGDERSLRPNLLKDFIGQNKTKENLRVFISASKKRGECLDHIFLSGPPGLGKTTLAGIIAHEMNAELRGTAAPALEKQGDLAAILTSIGKNNIFFIDEIHRLRPVIEEMLYTAMEDFKIDVVIGQGPGARTLKIPLAPFTLVGATTRPGLVSRPLHDRFGIRTRFDYYELEDISKIINRSADILKVKIEPQANGLIARCTRGTPRVANRLLRRMRDFAQVWGEGVITQQIAARGLKSLDIDEQGLDKLDRTLLRAIIIKYSGGPVGCETLGISVGESVETIEDVYEPYLIQKGFLMRTPRGRMATRLAYQHLGIENSKDEEQGLLF